MYFHHICFSFNYIHSFFQYFFFFSINWKLNFQSYFKSLLLKYNSSYSYRRRIFTWYFRQLKIEKDFPSGTIRLMIDKSCRDETTEERFVLDLIFPVHSFSISFNIDWIPQWLGRIRYLKKWYPMVARKKKGRRDVLKGARPSDIFTYSLFCDWKYLDEYERKPFTVNLSYLFSRTIFIILVFLKMFQLIYHCFKY